MARSFTQRSCFSFNRGTWVRTHKKTSGNGNPFPSHTETEFRFQDTKTEFRFHSKQNSVSGLHYSINPNKSLPIIHLSDITQDAKEDLIAKYVYNIQYLELGYIKSFETHIISSYAELGRPPREQTIEGQEARDYTHSLQQNHFGIQKLEKTIHGNPPCIMLANSIRWEDDHRIKAEIIDRLDKTKQQLGI